MDKRDEKILRQIYLTMQKNKITGAPNGVRMTGETGSLELVTPEGVTSPREVCGYMAQDSESILLEEFESDTAKVDRLLLSVVADTPVRSMFLDGADAMFAGAEFVYSIPLPMPLVRQHGKGHNMMLDAESARIVGLLAQIGGLGFEMSTGTMDGENLLIDIKAKSEDGLFHARFESPIIFAPWADFTELVQTLMGNPSVIVKPRIRSLKATLRKATDIVTPSRGDRSLAYAELIVKDGGMKVRPLSRTGSEDETYEYDDHRDPIEVKVDGFSGSDSGHYQFFPATVMSAALEIFGDDPTATLSVGSRIGDPILFMRDDNVGFAVRTGKRV